MKYQGEFSSPSRLELEGHVVGAILSDVVNLPLDNEARRLLLSEQSNVEEVAIKVPAHMHTFTSHTAVTTVH